MVCFDIQNYRQGGEKIQERIAIFTALQQNRIALAYPVTCPKQRQIAANHHRGVPGSRHQNVGNHGGGGGFSVGSGNTNGIFIGTHNDSPSLGPLKYRDA